MAAVEYEEDRSLNEEEQECAASALASVPQELAAGAFGGDTALLSQLLARCVRGEKQNAAKSLQSTLTWRKDMEADTVRPRRSPQVAVSGRAGLDGREPQPRREGAWKHECERPHPTLAGFARRTAGDACEIRSFGRAGGVEASAAANKGMKLR